MKRSTTVVIGVLLALACVTANAVVFVPQYSETWDTDGDSGWQFTNDAGSTSANGSRTAPNDSGFGKLTYAQQITISTPDTTPLIDRLFADSSASGGGFVNTPSSPRDYGALVDGLYVQAIQFDFYSYAVDAPAGLQLFFSSDSGGGSTWASSVFAYGQGSPVADWYTYTVAMLQSNFQLIDGSGTWGTAIADVDEIGIRLEYLNNTSGQIYGLDNFERGYLIPEPGTCAALGFAFLSLGITFRRKLNGALGRLGVFVKS